MTYACFEVDFPFNVQATLQVGHKSTSKEVRFDRWFTAKVGNVTINEVIKKNKNPEQDI